MNEIACYTNVTHALQAEPRIPVEMKVAIECFVGPSMPGIQPIVRHAAEKEAARLLAATYVRMCAPANRAIVEMWLARLATSVRNPPDEDGFARRLDAIIFALGDLPAGVWSKDMLKLAMDKFEFWPAVADLSKLLKDKAGSLGVTRAALQRMADAEVYVPIKGVTREQEIAYAEELAQARAQDWKESAWTESAEGGNVVPLNPRAPLPETFRHGQVADVLRRARERGFTPAPSAADPRRQLPAEDRDPRPSHASDGQG